MKYGVSSHFMVFLFGVVRALVIPVMLGVIEFGYWQLYLLYSGFVGVFTFGFNDGLYLRYGGKRENELPWKRLRGAFCFYLLALSLISLVLYTVLTNVNDVRTEKLIAFKYVIISVGLSGVVSLHVFLLQLTNQIKKYSVYMLIDKMFFVLMLSLIYFFYSDYNFEYIMVIDCLSKLLLIFIVLIDYREYIFGGIVGLLESWKEFNANISAGVKLMLANLVAMLALNISRFFVELYYPTEVFSVFSFGLTLTNLGLMLVIGVSVVLYPSLKQLQEEKYTQFYSVLSDLVTFTMFTLLFTYYPIYFFILNFIPDFKEVLVYFNILLALSLLQIKMNLSINTFYKVLRRERSLLRANLESFVLILFLSILVVVFDGTITVMVLAMLMVISFRVYSCDLYIKDILNIQNNGHAIFELSMLMVFILITKYMSLTMSFIILFIFFIMFAYRQKIKISTWFNLLKER